MMISKELEHRISTELAHKLRVTTSIINDFYSEDHLENLWSNYSDWYDCLEEGTTLLIDTDPYGLVVCQGVLSKQEFEHKFLEGALAVMGV